MEILQMKMQFKREKRTKYLGINVSNRTSSLMEDNYLKLMREVTQDLEKWDKLSLMGRIACIKMNVLPKFLFLFQTLPVLLKRAFSKI